jgi:putative flippase GtrA
MIGIQIFKKYVKANGRSMLLFPIIGALTAVVYFSLFNLMWYLLNIDYRIAVSIAYVTAATFQFFANRNLTFRSCGHRVLFQMIKYVVMVLINYVITMIVVHFVVEVLKLPPPVGVVAAIATTVVSGYLLSRYWVFVTEG